MLTPEIGGVKTPIIVNVFKKIISYCSLMFPSKIAVYEGFFAIGVIKKENNDDEKYSELLFHEVGKYKEIRNNEINNEIDYAKKARENVVLLIAEKAVSSREAGDHSTAGAILAKDLVISVNTNAYPKINEALAILLAQTFGWLPYEQAGKIIDVFIEIKL